ncbi:hypothetical protein [Streptomyces pseudovenezuelae]|uniref:hypothetical protein n=1 Tax=Streptomyces pseudovenezuelae TaxID=67350 RepID=UPI00371C3574
MNLHQTKGREADTTILLLGSNEFQGSEGEPYPTGPELLCVVLTRARNGHTALFPTWSTVSGTTCRGSAIEAADAHW